MKKLIFILLALTVTSCASYQFGDLSKRYCTETSDSERVLLKTALILTGVYVGADYCKSIGLDDE